MIPVSNKFLEIANRTYRPKCEPQIKVTTIDENGSETTLEWKSSNIKSFSYKRGIDPVGRTLPYMELTWTEVYKGKLNAQGDQMKYTQNLEHAAVDLSFIQNLGFRNTWDNLKNKTWGELSSLTWGQIKNSIEKETVTVPRLFLDSNPIVEGQTITWKAYDLLYFLNYTEPKEFKQRYWYTPTSSGQYQIPFVNPIKYLLINARSEFIKSYFLVDAIQSSLENLTQFQNENDLLFDGWIIFSDTFKNNLMNYAATESLYIDFDADGAFKFMNYVVDSDIKQSFSKKLIYKYPKITQSADISNYTYKIHRVTEQYGKDYEAPNPRSETFNGKTIYIYDFDGYGSISDFYSGKVYSEINRAAGISKSEFAEDVDGFKLRCGTLSVANEEMTIKNADSGEVYSESNPLWCYEPYNSQTTKRFDFLKRYFNRNTSSLEFETVGNIALEPHDTIQIDTNLYKDEEQITKKACIVSMEITYNGSIKEKIIAHEVNV